MTDKNRDAALQVYSNLKAELAEWTDDSDFHKGFRLAMTLGMDQVDGLIKGCSPEQLAERYADWVECSATPACLEMGEEWATMVTPPE